MIVIPAGLIAAGDIADGSRFIPRRCSCIWRGPFFTTWPAHWRRAQTDPACVLHGQPADPDAAAITRGTS